MYSGDNGQRADQDVYAGFIPKTQAAAADAEQTRAPLPKDLQTAADAHTQLRQATNPGRFAGDILNLRPSAGFNELQGK